MKIKVAIAGVGNCASALIQGVEYYKNADEDPIGVMHEKMNGYSIEDIEFVAAFDIDKRKVGRDLSEAVFSEPNCTVKISELPHMGVEVQKGPVKDGVCRYTKDQFLVDESWKEVDVTEVLDDSGAEILINYLPVGSEEGTRFYASQALETNTALVNAMPVFIASDPNWASKFDEKGVPIIGDDVKSQVGATIVHRTLAKLFSDRGVKINRSYQLNVGGNTDFLNMLDRDRLISKKMSKTQAVQSTLDIPLDAKDIHIGPSDYVDWLDDTKIAFIRLEGSTFGNVPINLELRLEVVDSPNSAGVMVDAIRLAKVALDRNIGGPLVSASAYLMKSPPEQYSDHVAREMVEEFIRGERKT